MQQKLGGMRKAFGHLVFTPVHQIVHGKLGGVGGLPDVNRTDIMGQIIEAIGNGFAHSLTGKVMDVDDLASSHQI